MIEYNLYYKSSAIEATVINPSWFNFSTFKKVICGTFLVPLGNTSFVCMKCLLFMELSIQQRPKEYCMLKLFELPTLSVLCQA